MARPKRDANARMQRLGEIGTSADPETMDISEVQEGDVQVSRPKRPPVYSKRNKLTVAGLDQENFYYRWCADRDGNIEGRLEEGFVFVTKDGKEAGERDANYSQSKSSLFTQRGGFGLTLYLMRIPIELWTERQKYGSQKDADDREAYIKEKVKTAKGLTGNNKVTFR